MKSQANKEVFQAKKMTFLDGFLLLIVAIIVIGALVGSGDGLSLVFKGGADKYKEFESPSYLRWIVAGGAILMVLGYVGFRGAIQTAKKDYAEYQTEFDKALEAKAIAEATEAREREELARQAERAAFEARISTLEGEVKVLRDDPDFRLVQAVTKVVPGASGEKVIPHTVIRHLLDDAFGEKELAVVYHLFDQNAFWEFNSPSNSVPPDFFQRLYSSPTAATLGTYDYVIGIGLASNSPGQVPNMSHRRAQFLCGVLKAILPQSNDTPVYGLAIGDYRQGELDLRNVQQLGQRPILIAGVERISPQLNEQALILEMMMLFEYSGFDLRNYSLIGSSNPPVWYEMNECDRYKLDFGTP